jgi:hypothetical protein
MIYVFENILTELYNKSQQMVLPTGQKSNNFLYQSEVCFVMILPSLAGK